MSKQNRDIPLLVDEYDARMIYIFLPDVPQRKTPEGVSIMVSLAELEKVARGIEENRDPEVEVDAALARDLLDLLADEKARRKKKPKPRAPKKTRMQKMGERMKASGSRGTFAGYSEREENPIGARRRGKNPDTYVLAGTDNDGNAFYYQAYDHHREIPMATTNVAQAKTFTDKGSAQMVFNNLKSLWKQQMDGRFPFKLVKLKKRASNPLDLASVAINAAVGGAARYLTQRVMTGVFGPEDASETGGKRNRRDEEQGAREQAGRMENPIDREAVEDFLTEVEHADIDDLRELLGKHTNGANLDHVITGKGARAAKLDVYNYIANTLAAKTTRVRGDISTALMYENIADRIHARLTKKGRAENPASVHDRGRGFQRLVIAAVNTRRKLKGYWTGTEWDTVKGKGKAFAEMNGAGGALTEAQRLANTLPDGWRVEIHPAYMAPAKNKR